MKHFHYKNGYLHAEDVNLLELAKHVPTPFYCYSQQAIIEAFLRYKQSFRKQDIIAYALKANSHQAILQLLKSYGAGADIVSGGELFRALKAGMAPQKIVYSGVGKTSDEIDYALAENVKCFNVESSAELYLIEARAKAAQKKAPISLRINPDIEAKSHKKISTGTKATKFGIPLEEAFLLYQEIRDNDYLSIEGIDIHIGSQIVSLEPFQKAFQVTKDFVMNLQSEGIFCSHIDIGGGLGIVYDRTQTNPKIEDYAACALDYFKDFEGQIICEPGRSIVGNGGILVTKLLYIKKSEMKDFFIVDGAMNDLIRPTLYEAYQEIFPIKEGSFDEERRIDFVGPVCETGDYLGLDRAKPKWANSGDFFAVMGAGAYGASMSSCYNSRQRVSEVFVADKNYALIQEKKPYQAFIETEKLPFWFEKNA